MTNLRTRVTALTLLAATAALPALSQAGGSNIGGSGRGSAMVADWCRGALGILDAARTQSTLALTMDDADGAREYLKQGLVTALARDPEGASLTHRALVRGLELTEALEATLEAEGRGQDAALFFLTRYYDFVERVATRIDLQYYIPYHGSPDRCATAGSCNGLDIRRFEEQFVVYAQDQIHFVLTHFASVSRARVTPVWSSKAFLKLLELSSQYAADDLADTLWALKYACVREKLSGLSQRLAHYNAGNRGVYPNDLYAVNSAYGDAYDSAAVIQSGCARR